MWASWPHACATPGTVDEYGAPSPPAAAARPCRRATDPHSAGADVADHARPPGSSSGDIPADDNWLATNAVVANSWPRQSGLAWKCRRHATVHRFVRRATSRRPRSPTFHSFQQARSLTFVERGSNRRARQSDRTVDHGLVGRLVHRCGRERRLMRHRAAGIRVPRPGEFRAARASTCPCRYCPAAETIPTRRTAESGRGRRSRRGTRRTATGPGRSSLTAASRADPCVHPVASAPSAKHAVRRRSSTPRASPPSAPAGSTASRRGRARCSVPPAVADYSVHLLPRRQVLPEQRETRRCAT